MINHDLAERMKVIKERRSKVTGLPWTQFNGSDVAGAVNDKHVAVCRAYAQPLEAAKGRGISVEQAAANIDFITNAPDDIDTLIALVEQQGREIAELKQHVVDVNHDFESALKECDEHHGER